MRSRGRGETQVAADTAILAGQTSNDKKSQLQKLVRILVADDDYDIRETLRIVLEDEGYLVDEASNGKKCLELMCAAPIPYVVLLDLMMPQLGGAGVITCISQDQLLAHRHAILLVTASSYKATEMLGDVLQQLHVPLIRKPYDLDTLISLVDQAALRIVPDAANADSRDAHRSPES
jgi:CheY-like chemotaxis protein